MKGPCNELDLALFQAAQAVVGIFIMTLGLINSRMDVFGIVSYYVPGILVNTNTITIV